jgi:PAS domain S-box-containing protein
MSISPKASRKESLEGYKILYTVLLDAIPSSVLLIDRNMRIVSANRNFLEKSRRSITDTVNHRLEEVFPPIILEYMDLDRRIRRVFETNQSTRGERMTYRAPGLPLRIYYYSLLPFCYNGVTQNAILLMEDITEQVHLSEEVRRVESHLVSIVESASDIVLSTDTEGKILSWNTAAEKLSGFSLPEIKGRYFFECCAEERRQEAKKIFRSLERKAVPRKSLMAEWNLIMKDGGRVPVSWVFSPMKDGLSRTVGIVGIGRDLTERRKFETQLLQSQKLAALGVMAGGIAHEIRNPLAVCSSAAQFLLEKDIRAEYLKECAQKIQTGIQRASGIIENLLRFARPSAKSEMAEIDLLQVIQETVTLVKNQAKIQKIEMSAPLLPGPMLINGNTSLLQQVFMNLFLNAIQAMPNGGSLNLSVERVEEEVLVYVTDTGQGIAKKDIENVFDPFYTTAPVGRGTGLGLSICYSIVKQHFGSIEVESTKGKGSAFIVRLPLLCGWRSRG